MKYDLCCQDIGDQTKDGDLQESNAIGEREHGKKTVIVPKNSHIPVQQRVSNIFDPKVCKAIDWTEKDVGVQSAPLVAAAATPLPETKKPEDALKEMPGLAPGSSGVLPSSGPPVCASGSQATAAEKTQQQHVKEVLAAARTGLLLYHVVVFCASSIEQLNNDVIAIEFFPETCARIGKAPGTYDKYDHQQLVETCVELSI